MFGENFGEKFPLGNDYDEAIQRSSLNNQSNILSQSECGNF